MLEIEPGELEMYYNCDENIIFIKSMLWRVEGYIDEIKNNYFAQLIDTYFTGG